eukprot:1943021-Prymnesium_polylepis.1
MASRTIPELEQVLPVYVSCLTRRIKAVRSWYRAHRARVLAPRRDRNSRRRTTAPCLGRCTHRRGERSPPRCRAG